VSVRHAEPLTITPLKVDTPPQADLDPLDMQGVDSQPCSLSFRDRAITPRLN